LPSPAPPKPVPASKPSPQPGPTREAIKSGDAGPHLLAHEQAEADRQTALHPIQPKAETKRYFKVKVRDAGSLEVDGPNEQTTVIQIDGIKAREADGLCTKADGSNWPCGAQARAALTRFIRARAVTCTLPPGGESAEFAARCTVSGEDLALWLVRQGWALPKQEGERALAEAMAAAKTSGLGLWQSGAAAP
jgi:endonuclease YncB( thermonuclease family)